MRSNFIDKAKCKLFDRQEWIVISFASAYNYLKFSGVLQRQIFADKFFRLPVWKRRERRKTFSLQSIKINCLAVLLFDAAIWIWFWISIESNDHSLCSLKLDKQEKCLFDVEKLFFRYERSHFCVFVFVCLFFVNIHKTSQFTLKHL